MDNFLTKLLPIKRRKKVTLSDFKEQVRNVAIKNGKTYYAVEVKTKTFINHSGGLDSSSLKFSAYIDGYTWYEAESISEVIKLLEDAANPTVKDNSPEVIIN